MTSIDAGLDEKGAEAGGFVAVRRAGKTARVHPEFQEAIGDALLDGKGCEAVDLGGRGALLRVEAGGGTALIRSFRRGGFLRHFLRDGYWFVNRPLRELEVHQRAFAAGLAVPEPLGACWERRGLVFRGRIATRELAGAVDLFQFLRDSEAVSGSVLEDCGALIRRMHDAGIVHADLQVRNVLVAGGCPYLIDFDKAKVRARAGRMARARNLLRLRRSFEKNGVPLRHFERVCSGYGIERFPTGLAGAYALKGWLSDLLSGRRRGGWHVAELTPGVSGEAVLEAVAAPGEILKESARSLTKRCGAWVVKIEKRSVIGGILRNALGNPQGRRGWDAANHLARQGIHVPAPRALLERRVLGFRAGQAVVSDFLEGCVNVEEYARGLVAKAAGSGAISEFLSALADAVNALVEAGAYHADLSGKNIFTADGAAFFFIDLDGVLLNVSYDAARRLKNHVQLYDSFCDVWDENLLGPFIARMTSSDSPREAWLDRVQQGQQVRRERQRRIWEKQGKS